MVKNPELHRDPYTLALEARREQQLAFTGETPKAEPVDKVTDSKVVK